MLVALAQPRKSPESFGGGGGGGNSPPGRGTYTTLFISGLITKALLKWTQLCESTEYVFGISTCGDFPSKTCPSEILTVPSKAVLQNQGKPSILS